MGLKRKACALEEPALPPHHPSTPPSLVSTSASPHSSPSSMCTEPYHLPTPLALDDFSQDSRSDAAPWLNMRTRKRVRDNRPAEQVIHYETLRKLYDAQRQPQHDEILLLPEYEFDASVDLDMAMDVDMKIDVDLLEPAFLVNDGATELSSVLEPNQRSLHDFFRWNTNQSHKSASSISKYVEMEQEKIPQRPAQAHSAVLPCDFAPAYRPQQQWRAEGMLFRSESEV